MTNNSQLYSFNNYFNKIINKYEYINSIWITDYEGALLYKELNRAKINENDLNPKIIEKIKGSFSFLLNSAYDQLYKTEKEKVNCIIAIYDNQTLIQAKVNNNNNLVHILSDTETCNISVIKTIITEIGDNLSSLNIEIN